MVKKIALFTLIFGAFSAQAMQKALRKFMVTRKCKDDVQKIAQDQQVLGSYLKAAFAQAANFRTKKTPSQLLAKHDGTEPTRINEELELPATTYIKEFIQPQAAQFDAAFQQKHAELQDIKQTWQWFTNHFEEHGIKRPFRSHMEKLLIEGEKEVEQRRKSIS
jgi:hypothetical protein